MSFEKLLRERAIERVVVTPEEVAGLLSLSRRDIATAEATMALDETVLIRRLQRLRRKRNATVYEQSGLVGEAEAREVIAFARSYVEYIETVLPGEFSDRSPD